MSNDNTALDAFSKDQYDQAGVRGTILELERQRNNAFTRAASIAGELEQFKLKVAELDRRLTEKTAVVENFEQAERDRNAASEAVATSDAVTQKRVRAKK